MLTIPKVRYFTGAKTSGASKKDSIQKENPIPFEVSFCSQHSTGVLRKSTRLFDFQIIFLRWLNKLPVKLTEHDTPALKQLRQGLLDNAHEFPPTSSINTLERQSLRAQIVAKVLQSQTNIKRTKDFYFLMGLYGSGKSTLSKVIAEKHQAFHIDADVIKFEIPELKNNPKFAYVVRSEGESIRDSVLDSAKEKGYSIIYEEFGIYEKEVLQILERMKASGYKIHLIMVDLPADKAAQRAISRYKETGKFSDPLLHRFFGKRPLKTYERLIESHPEYFSSYALYSSDVPKGEPFKFISGTNAIV